MSKDFVSFHRIDLVACDKLGHDPQDIIDREGADVWLVPQSPIHMDKPIEWAMFKTEKYVQIPLVPYLLRAEPELALAFLLALGLRCAMTLNREVRHVHISAGTPVEQLDPEANQGFGGRYLVGFAILLA